MNSLISTITTPPRGRAARCARYIGCHDAFSIAHRGVVADQIRDRIVPSTDSLAIASSSRRSIARATASIEQPHNVSCGCAWSSYATRQPEVASAMPAPRLRASAAQGSASAHEQQLGRRACLVSAAARDANCLQVQVYPYESRSSPSTQGKGLFARTRQATRREGRQQLARTNSLPAAGGERMDAALCRASGMMIRAG